MGQLTKRGNCHEKVGQLLWVEKNQKLISGGNSYYKPDSKTTVYHKKLDKNYTSQKL